MKEGANEHHGHGGLDSIRERLRVFAAERQWEQFHTPKNLASALVVEAAELLEPFQWLNHGIKTELGADQYMAVKHEMADVLSYLVMLADKLEIDLVSATHEKITLNALKYPVDKVKGDARKYLDYQDDIQQNK
ncbi:nucleotide pyrophosphohydrolase [Undibacterium jejuense]|uniref:Nucleotide pyrophosphohydrolase n=2 Tax=Undibacterium jejuense TaxID=1344949 RepID=A0A923HHU8_9BURK|nr:nucleotide pyrophosphohydrolase [Undibacterium jejuense]MBC3863275.1 nucleotide pyrophosphohydrolase [Undibacterium jejuense]